MKKQTKKGYSLTAKERKAQRRTDVPEQRPAEEEHITETDGSPAGTVTVSGAAAESSGPKHKTAIIVCSVFLAVVLIVLSVLTFTVFIPLYSYRNIDNPVAVIKLSNGKQIELEIFEKECPYAATNFLYLAQKGFFDGAVIVDTTNRYMRFGEFQSDDYKNAEGLGKNQWAQKMFRSEDDAFTDKLTDITLPTLSTSSDSVLDYRLAKEQGATAAFYNGKDNAFGYLSNILDYSGTAFQICGLDNAPIEIEKEDTNGALRQFEATGQVLGYCIDNESRGVVQEIAALSGNDVITDNDFLYWSSPKVTIRIESVKLYKMDRAKWRDFSWDLFYQNENNSTRYINWSGGSGLPR